MFVSLLFLLSMQFCEAHNSGLAIRAPPPCEGTVLCLLVAFEAEKFALSFCHSFEDYLFFLTGCFKNIILVFSILKSHCRMSEKI